ncbi:tRNA preQ1(34) S-adenosylmethionine ribosyltransferase-isomerase QueA [Halarsenatibacter silvermanii]|uniref:S-adenosylmethionine:tRNA ribosyltransferase-isomerase n=1 Tax=Halarsenatibacter silvermanii TaxID=321763 RepID=A0A1G9JS53_9FIRM|nr:tRNA preQ1(34) S-adenosylmethionine ribosyltransferase-isomerase QueA [Halarsenatibacter silvermanii]SDL40440.1 S-adenosylmethionine--tRNA ribosyltransferase-isomerase [Halarsenatibacter silvermanii]
MDVDKFSFDLPEELIAQEPAQRRDESRLLVMNKDGNIKDHSIFKNLLDFLQPGDRIVLNNSRVIPARLYGQKRTSGIEIEILLLNELETGRWEVLANPGRRVKPGTEIEFEGEISARCDDVTDFGGRILSFSPENKLRSVLDEIGEMPLPPYIKKKPEDPGRYQTIYASSDREGSVAAPTAGLHFTERLIEELRSKGIGISYLTLHVGLGTFRPVRSERVENHDMHSEYFELPEKTAKEINATRQQGGRIIAVGTTVTRTLEGASEALNRGEGKKGWTDLFIYPGYEFQVIDSLITNFHLPESTLIMLVSALVGREEVLEAYREAIERRYRFYSFGDAMLIL